MSHTGLSRHTSYNNRFVRSSSSDADHHTTTAAHPPLNSLSENVDMFGHSPHFGQLSFQASVYQDPQTGHLFQRMISSELPPNSPTELSIHGQPAGDAAVLPASPRQSVDDASRPAVPGKPRRLSRQTSADVKRHHFAVAKTASGEGKQIVTSVDSGCDDVFVEVGKEGEAHHHGLHDSSLFPNKRTDVIFSTSSTTSILPNPFNRFNHRIHSMLWCCSCVYFVFFCCLPAIHYMEQSDVEFNRNNQKRAQSLGRTSTFLFFTGTLITISMFALVFFLAIFFTVY